MLQCLAQQVLVTAVSSKGGVCLLNPVHTNMRLVKLMLYHRDLVLQKCLQH